MSDTDSEVATVRLDVKDLTDTTLCAESDWSSEAGGGLISEIEVTGWTGARLTSDDRLIDIPVETAVVVDAKNVELLELRLHAWIEADESDQQTTWENELLNSGHGPRPRNGQGRELRHLRGNVKGTTTREGSG